MPRKFVSVGAALPVPLCAAAYCLLSAGTVEAACNNPPVIGFHPTVPALTAQTKDRLEIQYHDQCSGERSTEVSLMDPGTGKFSVIKREGANRGGWRRAGRSDLLANTSYTFLVKVVGANGTPRAVTRSFRTKTDPACQNPPQFNTQSKAATLTTDRSITVEYHDGCSNESRTEVSVRKRSGGGFRRVKTDPSNSGGFRSATARGLAPSTQYEIKVAVTGTDGRVREATRILTTRKALAERPTAAVVLGDSFSSGEGGRWRGNAEDFPSGNVSKGDTDLSAPSLRMETVYDRISANNLCHRSLRAPVQYLAGTALRPDFPQRLDRAINLACSGARTKHLMPADKGGSSHKGEGAQITRLGNVADTHNVRLVTIGIGGNDLGFGDAVKACLIAWAIKHFTPADGANCIGDMKRLVKRAPVVEDRIVNVVREVRAALNARHQGGARIVLMGYPNILPGFSGFKFSAGQRRVRNCPFNGPDAQFVEDELVPVLNRMVANAARRANVSFVSLENAFDDHRLCQGGTERSSKGRVVPAAKAEWVRFVDMEVPTLTEMRNLGGAWLGLIEGTVRDKTLGEQGRLQESLHPNDIGQQAVGTCLRRFWAEHAAASAAPVQLACRNGGSKEPTDMRLEPLPTTES